MEWWTVLGIILGSGGFVALINLLSDRLRRRDAVTDKRDNTADQVEELRAETSEQFEQVNQRFKGIEENISNVSVKIDAVTLSTKAQAYDRIRHLGLTYIKAGCISADELENLGDMHKAYKKLGGDGFLDRLMAEVNTLRIKSE